MNVNIRNRFIIFTVITLLMFGVLFVQLFRLTIVKGEKYAAEADKLYKREITVSGARGSILDQSGLPLAYDQKSFNVQFYRDPNKNTEADRAYYTGIIIDTIGIIEGNNEQTVDTFAIKFNAETGEFYFDFGITNEKAIADREANWRKNMYVDKTLSPEQIYLFLRDKYQIPEEMDFTEASKILSIWQDVQMNSWVAYEPVDVAYNVSIQTVAEIETHSAQLEGMSIAESTVRIYPRGSVAAHVIGYEGRITEDILVRYTKAADEEVAGRISARMADDILKSYDTLKEASTGSLTDFRFSEDEIAGVGSLLDLGYKVDDLIGVEGIEKSMEAYLTGNTIDRQGKEVVEVDNMAVVQNVVSSTEPAQGDNVMLTLDMGLQLIAEKALADEIPEIYDAQVAKFIENKDTDRNDKKIGDYTGLKLEELDLARSGAVVVLDVNTGNVLAMANNPSYDLNLFTGGIDDEIYKALRKDKAAPLFNKATQSLAMPGSVFKMVTATAALMEGKTDLSEKTSCDYWYTDGIDIEDAPHCWDRSYSSRHQDQTVVQGLKNSCNFYFFTLAGRLGIDNLDKWGDKYGLTTATGIELPNEAVGIVGNQELLYNADLPIDKQKNSLPMLVYKTGVFSMVNLLKGFAEERDVEYSDALIEQTAETLVELMGMEWDENWEDAEGYSLGDHIRSILSDMLNIRTAVSKGRGWDVQISSVLMQLHWSKFMTVTTGIGQGITEVTPIAVARYVAAVANGGTVYEAHVVDKVLDQEGNVVYDQEPVVFDTLGANEEYIKAIQEGMSDVVSAEEGGTAAGYFKNFPDEYLKQIAGKTGTAQVSTVDLENNSWFVCFAPYSKDDPTVKPEIAVVVYIPNGLAGGYASYVAQDILQYWFDRQKIVAEQTIPAIDTLMVPEAETTTN